MTLRSFSHEERYNNVKNWLFTQNFQTRKRTRKMAAIPLVRQSRETPAIGRFPSRGINTEEIDVFRTEAVSLDAFSREIDTEFAKLQQVTAIYWKYHIVLATGFPE